MYKFGEIHSEMNCDWGEGGKSHERKVSLGRESGGEEGEEGSLDGVTSLS